MYNICKYLYTVGLPFQKYIVKHFQRWYYVPFGVLTSHKHIENQVSCLAVSNKSITYYRMVYTGMLLIPEWGK